MNELAAWLKEHDDFVLLGHVSIDGDCVGSCIAAALALKALGKRVYAYLPDGIPEMFQGLPCADVVVTEKDPAPFEARTAFALDVSDLHRLGRAGARFDGCEAHAALDHHATNAGFGEITVIDGAAAATGELVVDLIEALGVALTKEMALWLFVAISTDTGHFSYSNVRTQTFDAAAKLARVGVDVAGLTQRLYRTRSKARTLLLGKTLANLEVSHDGRMAWARLTEAMFQETGALREDNEGIVNYLLEIEGVQFAALAEERDGAVKFSLRSKDGFNVAEQVAIPFGGGGHAQAAGCTLNLPMEDALQRVLAQASAALH